MAEIVQVAISNSELGQVKLSKREMEHLVKVLYERPGGEEMSTHLWRLFRYAGGDS